MKTSENINCPHCGGEGYYTFYLGTDMLNCQSCKKPFDIKTKTVVTVVGCIPTRECHICGHEFVSNEGYDDKVTCPKCNNKTYNFE